MSLSLSSPRFLLPISILPKPPSNSITLIRSSSSSFSSASSSFNLQSYWSTLLSQINSHLDSALPIRYPESIYRSMRHSLLSPAAKRAPPVMCIAAAELISSPSSRPAALPTAAALEMVHAASLVHDDLPSFDAAPSRRGQPSTHSLFGVDLAVLAGDALLPFALSHIASSSSSGLVPSSTIIRIIQEITRAVGSTGMAAGQFLDLINNEQGTVAEEESVMIVLEKKFGEMAECSAVCGGLIGGAGEEELERLRRYGRAVGVLYQVVDDVLMESENGRAMKMRSNASVVKMMGMERALEIVEELREKAKKELVEFGDKYGERVMPLYSFVDYAVVREFVVAA